MVQTSIFVNMLGLIMVAPPGFEPGSQDPESQMMDHYTTGLTRIQPNSVHKKTMFSFHHKIRHHHRLRRKIQPNHPLLTRFYLGNALELQHHLNLVPIYMEL